MYQIYMHIAPNGAAYIGQTANRKKRDAAHRSNKRTTPLNLAISRFGWDAFEHVTLADGLTKSEADALEMKFIAEYNTLYPNGLNLHPGGSNSLKVNDEFMRDMPLKARTRRKNKKEPRHIEITEECQCRPYTEEEARAKRERALSIPDEIMSLASKKTQRRVIEKLIKLL